MQRRTGFWVLGPLSLTSSTPDTFLRSATWMNSLFGFYGFGLQWWCPGLVYPNLDGASSLSFFSSLLTSHEVYDARPPFFQIRYWPRRALRLVLSPTYTLSPLSSLHHSDLSCSCSGVPKSSLEDFPHLCSIPFLLHPPLLRLGF